MNCIRKFNDIYLMYNMHMDRFLYHDQVHSQIFQILYICFAYGIGLHYGHLVNVCEPAIITEFIIRIYTTMNMKEKVDSFRAITQDYALQNKDAQKFVKWAKGDIQQALNYYYNHLEKGKIKYKSHPQRKTSPEQEQSRQIRIQCSEDQGQNSNAFSILRRGSIKQQKTHNFIDKVRKMYKLPIKGKSQSQLISNSQQKIMGSIPKQFQDSDYLPNAFNMDNIQNLQAFKFQDNVQQKQYKSQTLVPKQKKKRKYSFEQQKPIAKEVQYKIISQKQQLKVNKQFEEHSDEQQQQQCMQIMEIQQEGNNENKNYQFSEEMHEKQIYVGQYFIQAFCTQRIKLDMLHSGEPVQIVHYIQELKTKKKGFSKKKDRVMHMRIYSKGKQIGRIQDNQVRIIMPLIDQKLIRMQFFVIDFPMFGDLFKPIKLKGKAYFQKKLITEPIVQTFEVQQKDKDKVQQISALLIKLNLPILVEPLVRGKSKYIKQKPTKKQKQSIDLFNYRKYQQQQNNRRASIQKQRQMERIKVRNDPNYHLKQKSITDMIGGSKSGSSNSNQKKQFGEQTETKQMVIKQGQVQKKVIQIDTKVQKDKFSELIDLHEENIEEYHPPENFNSVLYGYQALALAWMLKRQGFKQSKEDKQEIHPLWSQYQIPVCPKYRLFFNQLTGQVCVKRPISKIQCKGGILADQMGLGKTVMMAALIVSHKPQKSLKQVNGGTLVIVPLTLLSQWQSQLSKHTKDVKVLIYYSSTRKSFEKTLKDYDVVISTYGTVSHQFSQGCHIKKTGIFKLKWHRIILDEAHYIKGRIIQTSKAMYELVGKHKWCLTGTPIQNVVGDLFSLLHFIKYTPWSEHACWNRFIEKPLEEGQKSIFQVLKTILRRVFLRRTKNSSDSDGKPIVSLPPRISKIQLLTMDHKQRQFYDSVYQSSRIQIDALIQKGILQAKYMQVLQMLIRLRQICCHPVLFKSIAKFSKNTQQFEVQLKKMIQRWKIKSEKEQNQNDDQYYEPIINADYEEERVKTSIETINFSQEYFKQVMDKVGSGNLDICIMCLNNPEDPVITPCLHIFCKPCLIRQIQQQAFCPCCRRKINRDDFMHLPREDRLNLKQRQDIFLSTKMKGLMEHLKELKPGEKAVVFSQFLGFLDLLQKQIRKMKIKFVRMQGSNTHKQRTKIVKQFQQDKSVQIFLVSLKTAGVGLNLVAANRVFLMDPWWNPAVQQQAIERVHRIGQQREVIITRFIMDKTIQARMLQLNTEKKLLSNNVLSKSNDDNNHGQKVQKLKYLMQTY